MISIDNVSIRFGDFTLFDRISFQVNPGDRIGLVGRNGAGKTTLLNLIDFRQEPDEGRVVRQGGRSVGYLPQQMRHQKGKTLYRETLDAFEHILELENRIEEINQELAEREDHESASYLNLIQELSNVNESFEMEGGHSIHANVEQTLLGLGFRQTDMSRPVHEFSGGWRMRVELAKILLRKPDYILLDEPTNHLDIESIQWLEHFLSTYAGGVLIISHDRAFLDHVTNRTLELTLGKIYDYKVPYSKYVKLKKERIAVEQASYENQQKLIQGTEEFINRFRYKATKAVQVQSRIKQLEKLDRIEVEKVEDQVMNLKFPPSQRSGKIVVSAQELTKAFGDAVVLDRIGMEIERGEKVAFVGRNGEGKTTLSRILVGELDHQGGLRMGHNVELGYFAQNQDEIMDGNLTVLETVDRAAVGEIRTKIRDILGAFLFQGEDVDKKVRVLSGGERSRLAMARMLLQPFNLLILDEPTNHLDIRSKDILKQALLAFDGTLILVSHDRDFLDGLVDKVFEFRDHKVNEHLGGIYDFLRRRRVENLQEIERRNTGSPAGGKGSQGNAGQGKGKRGNAGQGNAGQGNAGQGNAGQGKGSQGKGGQKNSGPVSAVASVTNQGVSENSDSSFDEASKPTTNKEEYARRKEEEKKIRKIVSRVKALEREVEQLEEELAKMDELLLDPSKISDNQVYEDYEKLKNRLDTSMSNWEKQTLALEKAEARRK